MALDVAFDIATGDAPGHPRDLLVNLGFIVPVTAGSVGGNGLIHRSGRRNPPNGQDGTNAGPSGHLRGTQFDVVNTGVDAIDDEVSVIPQAVAGEAFAHEMPGHGKSKRLIVAAMAASTFIGATIGFLGSMSYTLAAVLLTVYGIVIWLDSSSLTAGTAGTAEPSRRGATLAVHSMLGYAGGFVGPLLVGWVLDLSGGMSQLGWGLSFFSVAMLMALALLTFWVIRPRELEGDKAKAT